MKTQVLNKEGLSTYDQEIKDYIKSQSMGVTLEEVQALIDSSEENTTYTLTKNENNEIVLTGSDGSTTSVTDTDTNTWRGIQNNLTSDSTTDSLSAAQGKVLKDLVDGKASSSHTHSAYVNQNAFSNIVVGSTTVSADSATDSLTLVGSNVTLTPDATKDKVTIGITKSNVTSALGYTPNTPTEVDNKIASYDSEVATNDDIDALFA